MKFVNFEKNNIKLNHMYWVQYEKEDFSIDVDIFMISIIDNEIVLSKSGDINNPILGIRPIGISESVVFHYNKENVEEMREKIKAELKNEIIISQPNPFISIKKGPKADQYTYSERKGIDSVAFIIQTGENKYILTSERKPPMDARIDEKINGIFYNEQKEAFITTAFGGSNDKMNIKEYKKLSNEEKIDYFKNIVQIESIEEAGYKVKKENIHFISEAFVSTQSNQICYLYLVDGRNAEIVDRKPDSEMEAVAELRTYSKEEIFKETIDWKAKTILGY